MSGIQLVRLPHLNADPYQRGAYAVRAPRLGGILYGGLDRMPWFDVDEEYYAGTLPAGLATARTKLKKNNSDFTGIELCQDLTQALELLRYANRSTRKNELIAVRSERLARIKGAVDLRSPSAKWIGYDVVGLGEWSLIREGLFAVPSAFAGWETELNEDGLFPLPAKAAAYARAYLGASRAGLVEELAAIGTGEGELGIDTIEVARISA